MGERANDDPARTVNKSEWLTPQIVSQMAGEGWTAAKVRDCIASGEIRAARKSSKVGKAIGWLIHRSEADRFVRRVTGAEGKRA